MKNIAIKSLPSPRYIDMAGKRFGRLVGINLVEPWRRGRSTRWKFHCDCGNELVALGTSVRTGDTVSCGCYKRDVAGKNRIKHGMANTSEYIIWKGMRRRCSNPKCSAYKNYGGRGITVCKEWDESFQQFYKDMGPRPLGLTLERINNDLGYSKENCVWATRKQQRRNQRRVSMSVALALEAKKLREAGGNVAAWARERGIEVSVAERAAIGKTWV
jgi:hypothetical protein